MAELCFNQTCVFNPLDNVSFTFWVLYAHMINYCSVHVSRHTLDIHKCLEQIHESGNHFKIVDCNENLPYANPLKRKLLEMHKIPP